MAREYSSGMSRPQAAGGAVKAFTSPGSTPPDHPLGQVYLAAQQLHDGPPIRR